VGAGEGGRGGREPGGGSCRVELAGGGLYSPGI